MIMKLHDKTISKINQLFNMGEGFCEQQLVKYEDAPDVSFIINAFDTIFTDFKFKLKIKEAYTIELYHEEIFNFDSIMASWREHLTYYITSDSNDKNDLYSVLFSILQGIETIVEDDHFYWEEDEELTDEAETFIEKEF